MTIGQDSSAKSIHSTIAIAICHHTWYIASNMVDHVATPPFVDYLTAVLPLDQLPCVGWEGQLALPLVLRKRFDCWRCELLGHPVLFAIDGARDEPTPGQLAKQIQMITGQAGMPVAYVRGNMTALGRLRLAEQGVPFVVPGKQCFLPPLGIDFREQFMAPKQKRDYLSPSAQALLFAALLNRLPQDGSERTPTHLAERLGYGAITLSRAFDELTASKLLTVSKQGRRRVLAAEQPRQEIWQQAQGLLRTPVTGAHHIRLVKRKEPGPVAGLTALAQRTMLADPGPRTLAISRAQWKLLCKNETGIEEVPAFDAGALCMQVWSYEPLLLGAKGQVDPLSLYTSLVEDTDERTRMACEELLKEVPW
ncbi:MAG: hypothetical protein PF961_08760 [Planctomycetota bacterium]|nr:hypothetical protein [Planctomycetota bacterium]